MEVMEGIDKITLTRNKFVLKACQTLKLPPYKGSCLRGGFGITFRRICCVNKVLKECHDCSLKEKCAYAYIFETSPPAHSQKLKKISEIPRPFVIEPPLDKKIVYKEGEEIEFTLILVGRASEYLPYFVFTFQELGNIGLGKGRGKFYLSEVYGSSGEKIYAAESGILENSSFLDIAKLFTENFPSNILKINFLTPSRIKFRGDLVTKPEFHLLIRALFHRISALAYFHCGFELKLDYNFLILQAEKIKIKKENLEWFDWERYSSRQDTRMKLGGFIGEVTYAGDFKPFLPLLVLGQFTHIGKNCTFGLGKYEIEGGGSA
ncbi:MAG: CRISPR system precrRNA processing endoribonuclease RAMP protein Cas6 [Candidatus Omnitrophica bacterium]|nr:CRISPR system precrRNA processing endoribonuclease RAMP protein Cas6 [Candidatus Omnitrophota bacterium]